jgi:hypothetical protein
MAPTKLNIIILIFFLGNVFACSPYNGSGQTDKINRPAPEKKTDTLSSKSIPDPTPKDSLNSDTVKTVEDKETTKKVDIRYIKRSINLHKRPFVASSEHFGKLFIVRTNTQEEELDPLS